MTFKEKLVILRKAKGLTQDEFAAAVGVGMAEFGDAEKLFTPKTRYEPKMSEEERSRLKKEWHRAVERAKGWLA